jgi:predicted RNA-binding protein associated with RNAse of E/G family
MHPSSPLVIASETVLAAGYQSTWFLYDGQPWDVARISRPDGTTTGYYADVLDPVHWLGSDPETLEPIVDLFLDLWIALDGTYTVLDEDELHEAVERRWVTPGQAATARRTLEDLIAATRLGDFPPDEVRNHGEYPRP